MRKRTAATGGFSLLELIVVVIVLAVVLLLVGPGILRSRDRSRRIRCASNLKQIGLAFKTWALDNKDRFPMRVSEAEGGPPNQAGLAQPDPVAAFTYQVFGTMSNELVEPVLLVCPSDNSLSHADFRMFRGGVSNVMVGGRSTMCNLNVSYFVGRDADESNPGMILAGDRNIYGGGSVPHDLPVSGINGGYGNSPVHAGGPLGLGAAVAMGTNLLAGDASPCWTARMHHELGMILFADGSEQEVNNLRLRAILAASGDTNAPPRQNMLLFP